MVAPHPLTSQYSLIGMIAGARLGPWAQRSIIVQGIRGVISTLTSDGQEIMGPGVLVWHYPDNSIVNNSLLTVESNHFCVLKSRGAILNVYDTGQYPVTTPDRPILGSFTQAFFGGQSPWQYEALYINRAKMVVTPHRWSSRRSTRLCR
jgi:membrane protease subunit (stomatin/prohibitin family)